MASSPNVVLPPTLGNPPESAGLLGKVVYYCHQYWIDVGDPRTANFPMVSGGAWKIAAVLIIYWLLVKKILPAYMLNRKPYSLVNVIRLYNTFMVLVNALFFVILMQHIDYGRRFLDFRYPDRADTSEFALNELNLAWYGYLSRYLDMLDTIFFVLRKKQNQISFLHVYHHMIVPFLGMLPLLLLLFKLPNNLFIFQVGSRSNSILWFQSSLCLVSLTVSSTWLCTRTIH